MYPPIIIGYWTAASSAAVCMYPPAGYARYTGSDFSCRRRFQNLMPKLCVSSTELSSYSKSLSDLKYLRVYPALVGMSKINHFGTEFTIRYMWVDRYNGKISSFSTLVTMESGTRQIKSLIFCNKEDDFIELLRSGLDPNFEGGLPIRLAARYGCTTIVDTLLQFGANPHLLSESGASTLQLAVFSGDNWNTDKWSSLLSCCDSSQLADGAAVAIVFNNVPALKKILATGRCNTNIPTTLTGKTLELLAKGYKLTHLMDPPTIQNYNEHVPTMSPRISRQTDRLSEPARATLSPYHAHRNLSPSVARFFHQTASQTALSPTRGVLLASSPK